jgi:hypothetical protein
MAILLSPFITSKVIGRRRYFYSINIAQSMVLGETASWEDSQRQLIAKDTNLLQSFQTLKYVNGESQSFEDLQRTIAQTSQTCVRSVALLVSQPPVLRST